MTRSAACFLLLSLLSCATGESPRPPTLPGPQTASPLPPPLPEVQRLDLDLLRRVDEAIQARFPSVKEADIKGRRFGMSRVAPREYAHPRVFAAQTAPEREMVRDLERAGWRGSVYAVADGSVGNPGSLSGPVAVGSNGEWAGANRRSVATLGLDCLKAGRPLRGRDGDISLEARPVFASRGICLRCHQDRKEGDVVGAVVYAFVKERAWVSSSGQ